MGSTLLLDDYTVEEMQRDPFGEMLDTYRSIAFPDLVEFRYADLFTDKQREDVERLRDRTRDKFVLRLVVRCGEDIVGWSVGVQANAEQFRMANSAVLPGHRRKGIYTALLLQVLERARAEGFQTVTSHHHPTNNAVLIAKLKAGFIITGMEITDDYAALVNMTHFFDPRRLHALGVRACAQRPTGEVRALLNDKS